MTVRFQDTAGKKLAEDTFELNNGHLHLASVAYLGVAVETLRYVDNPAMAAAHHATGLSVRVFQEGDIVRYTGEPVLQLERYITKLASSASNVLWPARPKVQ